MDLLLGQDRLRKAVTTNPQASSWIAFPDFVVGKLGCANILKQYILVCMLQFTAGMIFVACYSLDEKILPRLVSHRF